MTFDEIWKQLCKKRPGLSDPLNDISIDSENLKKLLMQVYQQGRNKGRESGQTSLLGPDYNFEDIFGGLGK